MVGNDAHKAWIYFLSRTKKVYIERCTKIESFEEYLAHRYRDNCYYYSGYAIMGLKPQDYLVRGELTLKDEWPYQNGGYRHGWVEFMFENKEYVFDSMLKTPVPKKEYYDYYQPQITYKKSQKEILDTFLKEPGAIKIDDDFWQFKYYISSKGLSYEEIMEYDRTNGYLPSVLMLSRIQFNTYTGEITRFIAYSEPS